MKTLKQIQDRWKLSDLVRQIGQITESHRQSELRRRRREILRAKLPKENV